MNNITKKKKKKEKIQLDKSHVFLQVDEAMVSGL